MAPTHKSTMGRGGQVSPAAELLADIFSDLRSLLTLFPPLMQRAVDLGVHRVLKEVEMPLASQLAQMESHGLCLSTSDLQLMAAMLREQIAALDQQAEALTNQKFNLASPEQVWHIRPSPLTPIQ